MSAKKHHRPIRESIQRRVSDLLGASKPEALEKHFRKAEKSINHAYWLADYCAGFSTARIFLDETKSDLVSILYAAEIGLERSAYLHARSALENLVRHCFYDTRPAILVSEQLVLPGTTTRRSWAEFVKEISILPHFAPAVLDSKKGDASGRVAAEEQSEDGEQHGMRPLFDDLADIYGEACRFVHAPMTADTRGAIKGIRAVGMSDERSERLTEFLPRVCDVTLLMLALHHLGPYLLIPQPIRTYMLKAMQQQGRTRFLSCLNRVSLGWARHQRDAALTALRGRRRKTKVAREGLLIEASRISVVPPNAESTCES
ncbi:hypothetical protein [Sorangium sp. So ce542]|uniref:hypothetical protein n=1 Tax=Sorangium sp. So ce542 TaxID=3133316 RepID=UPI003F63C801